MATSDTNVRSLPLEKALIILCVLLFAVRFIGLDNPMTGAHHWRQTQTAGTIRNFHESGHSILYPQVDWGGDGSGYIEMEFPIYQYVVAKLYDLFGPHDELGRLVSILCSLFACIYLFLLVRDISDRTTGLWALAVYLSLHVATYYSRVVMVESLLILATTGTLWHMLRFSRVGGALHWAASSIWLSIACLLKLTPLYLGLPLAWLLYRKYGRRMFLRWDCWLFAALPFLFIYLWYGHAAWLGEQGGLSVHLDDKILNWDLLVTGRFWWKILYTRFMHWHMSPPLFWLVCAGLPYLAFRAWRREGQADERLYLFWFAALMVFLILTPLGNYVHGYYQVPFLPVFAVIAAVVFGHFVGNRLQFRLLPLVLVAVLGFQIAWSGMRYEELLAQESEDSPVVRLGRDVQRLTPEGSLLAVMSNGCPCMLYYSHRKGWLHLRLTEESMATNLERADYLVGVYGHFNDFADGKPMADLIPEEAFLVNDPEYFIIDAARAREAR